MHCLIENGVPEAWLKGVSQHQIDPAAKQLLKKLLQVHIGIEGFVIEFHQEIQVAPLSALTARSRTEQSQPLHTQPPDLLASLLQRFQYQVTPSRRALMRTRLRGLPCKA